MSKTITYGTMFRKLQRLGFSKKKVEYRGKPAIVFIHKEDESAMLAFPDMDLKEPVRPIHLAGVQAILNSHGIGQANGVQMT